MPACWRRCSFRNRYLPSMPTGPRRFPTSEKSAEETAGTAEGDPVRILTAGAVWDEFMKVVAAKEAAGAEPAGGTGDIPDESRLIAHTGLCGKATQNSLLAFQLAGQAGYWAIETDVRWSADQVLVCYHDERVDRYTEGSGLVENLAWEELSALKVSAANSELCGPQPIATFESYLDTCKEYGCHALIDLKWTDAGWRRLVDDIYEMVAAKDMVDLAIFQCSLDFFLQEIHRLNPDAVCWFLCGEGNAEQEETIKRAADELGCLGVNVPVISEAAVALAHDAGMACTYYVTDSAEAQKRCFDLGYDYVMENGWN